MVQAVSLPLGHTRDDVRFWLYDVEDGSLKIERFSQLLYLVGCLQASGPRLFATAEIESGPTEATKRKTEDNGFVVLRNALPIEFVNELREEWKSQCYSELQNVMRGVLKMQQPIKGRWRF